MRVIGITTETCDDRGYSHEVFSGIKTLDELFAGNTITEMVRMYENKYTYIFYNYFIYEINESISEDITCIRSDFISAYLKDHTLKELKEVFLKSKEEIDKIEKEYT